MLAVQRILDMLACRPLGSRLRAASVQYLAEITQGRSEIGRCLANIAHLRSLRCESYRALLVVVAPQIERLWRRTLLGCQKALRPQVLNNCCVNLVACHGIILIHVRFWHNLNFSALPPPEEQAELQVPSVTREQENLHW